MAEELLIKSLKIKLNEIEYNHPFVAKIKNNLANILKE